MAKKTLGYVKLEWTCPNCGVRNPGPQKTCTSCGSPQPDEVKFEQAAQEKLITDEAEMARARLGPDIHCYYCGARNPADAKTCSQCGADLSEGAARTSGQVLGAHRTRPAEKIPCPACDTPNEPDAPKCVQCGASLVQPQPAQPRPASPARPGPQPSRSWLFGGLALLLVVCACVIGFFVFSSRTEDVTGNVRAISWTRSITVEALTPVSGENWRDSIPPGVVILGCTERVHHTESQATGQTREICGTPYTVDQGSGFGEVAQDCTTEPIYEEVEVYADFCDYTTEVWQEVDRATLSGNDFDLRWPDPRLTANQREGVRAETYRIDFNTEAGIQTYTTDDFDLYQQCQIGSQWILKVDGFNAIRSIEPAQ